MTTEPFSTAALLDPIALRQQLMTADPPVPILRSTLQAAQAILHRRFRADPKSAPLIKQLVAQRAWLIDQLLLIIWESFPWKANDHISLIAVGGYGRGELHPHSDIDLLILIKDPSEREGFKTAIEKFLLLLWDIGLEVGHSVRTLAECREQAAIDITIATNLMEARTIAGTDTLRQQMSAQVGPDSIWPSAAFFKAKWDEQISRHRKHNNTEYNLEPHIKEAPGGLRDIQMIGWVAKRHFGATTLHDLVTQGFLTETEYTILDAGQSFIWQIRYALHMLTDRCEDRLLFDHQKAIAELMGYTETEGHLAVELFMKRYYRTALTLGELNDMLLQHFNEAILRAQEKEIIKPINRRFQIRNNYIEITQADTFRQHPSALLEIFVIMGQRQDIQGIRAATIRAIREQRYLIGEKFHQDIRNTSLFMELLRSPYNLFSQLRRMKRYGVLGRYIPAFGEIIGQSQYDLFHIYTVDAHTFTVIKNMRRFRYENLKKEFPLVTDVVTLLPKIELLYIAGLFHDIGKGRGGDHSELGAEDAIAFCRQHRLSTWDTHLVAWLVKNHLLMSMTAQRKDISDPEIIREFATRVKDQIHLNYLYVLTVADIWATNPNLWNSWRASLLRQLYSETKRALRRGLEDPIDKQDWIQETQRAALNILSSQDFTSAQVQAIWDNFGDDYFLRDSPSDIAWHTSAIIKHNAQAKGIQPLILVRETTLGLYEGGTQLFIYTPDRAYLFAVIAAALDQLNLSIQDARIITSTSHFSLDTFIVLEANGTPIGNNPARIEAIQQFLYKTLANPEEYPTLVKRHVPRQLKHFMIPTQVNISHEPIKHYSVLEIIAADRPGLLARIGRIFLEFGLIVQNAKIATLGERVDDIFFVTDQQENLLNDATLCQRLQKTLCEQLDQYVQ